LNSKLNKARRDLKKASEKLAEWQQRVKELQSKCREMENATILELVHAESLTLEQLDAIIRMAKAAPGGIPPVVFGNDKNDQEEIENDEDEAE
jgi:hypothetical protein